MRVFLPIVAVLVTLPFYETEHEEHNPYDVRRLTLPRLFSLFLNPSLYLRSITINGDSLFPFITVSRAIAFSMDNSETP